jgi:hypothetical protein
VAFHALQATAFQAFGGIGLILVIGLFGLALAAAWLITGLLSLALVGLLLLPLALGLTLLALAAVLALAAGALIYPLDGAYRTYLGEAFEYPGVGRLVASTLTSTVAPQPDA